MMKAATIASALALAACSQGGDAPDSRPVQLPSNGAIAETVNGTPVPETLLAAVARGHNLDLTKPSDRAQSLKLTTDFVLLAQDAQQSDFISDIQFRADVEAARLQGLGNATMARLQQQSPVTDAVVKAEYEAQVARAGKTTYDFSQLLFDNQDEASKAEAELLAGKPFATVFDAYRTKAKQAKAFSRVRQDQLPDELAKVLAGLGNNENSKAPVKTEFGWHVVHLDISNPFSPPPFEQVKDSVRSTLLLQIGQQRLEKLKEQAKIEYPAGVAAPDAPTSAGASAAPSAPVSVPKKPD